MTIQRALLRSMLWTLGFAALAGVLLVLTPQRHLTGRLFLTGLWSAASIGIAMSVARFLVVEKGGASGLIGLGVVVVSFVTGLMAIWIGLVWPGHDWRLGLTALVLLGSGLVAAGMFRLAAAEWGRFAGRFGASMCAVVFLLVTLAIWGDRIGFGNETLEIGMTASLLTWLSIVAIACLIGGRDQPLGLAVRALGLLCTLAALIIGLNNVWSDIKSLSTTFTQCVIIACVAGFSNLVIRFPLPSSQRWLACGAAVSGLLTGVSVSALLHVSGFEWVTPSDTLVRLSAGLGIITACATLALVVLYRMNRRVGAAAGTPAIGIGSVLLTCPRCRTRQDAPIGTSGCRGCGLLISVSVAEPRCEACGYITLDLRGDRCPECGAGLTPRGRPFSAGSMPPSPNAAAST
ncbi:MAG: hypothetical protein JNK25_01380 [Phycisphaerae bacterium]|nr:hypothetical protein [Phycisphaerae bacterium]